MPVHLADELVVNRAVKPLLQRDGRNEPRRGDAAACEVRLLRELPDPYRAHGELAPRDQREQVEAEAAQIREVHEPSLRPPECAVHVEHERVHVMHRSIAVVVQPLARLRLVPDAPLDKRRHVLHVVHALAVRAAPHHRESPARHLAQQVVHVATVPLAEDDRRADYHRTVFGILPEPCAVLLLREPLRAAVVVEVADFPRLVRARGREAVDRYAASEDYPADFERCAGGAATEAKRCKCSPYVSPQTRS